MEKRERERERERERASKTAWTERMEKYIHDIHMQPVVSIYSMEPCVLSLINYNSPELTMVTDYTVFCSLLYLTLADRPVHPTLSVSGRAS